MPVQIELAFLFLVFINCKKGIFKLKPISCKVYTPYGIF